MLLSAIFLLIMMIIYYNLLLLVHSAREEQSIKSKLYILYEVNPRQLFTHTQSINVGTMRVLMERCADYVKVVRITNVILITSAQPPNCYSNCILWIYKFSAFLI
jgi:hypothetical protein